MTVQNKGSDLDDTDRRFLDLAKVKQQTFAERWLTDLPPDLDQWRPPNPDRP